MNAPQFGPLVTDDGVEFRLWAPAASSVDVITDQSITMDKGDAGWFRMFVPGASAGTKYKFRVDNKTDVPDPASHFQPNDIAGPSEVVDHTDYVWRTRDWRGRPWQDAVFIETHVGTFTQDGTYRAMIDKLDHLVQTGFTALELMPLADFPGRWNWGYDGVLWYAPDSAYGTPDDLKALIDECHLRGLMVFLDVVYNHFGPDGNFLNTYAPQFFSKTQTPWGNAIDYRVPVVCDFVVENALHWLRNYRFDGLRLDAVHAITETGNPHILNTLSKAVGDFAKSTGRQIHLVLENDDNKASYLEPSEEPSNGHYRAQWNDDFHHAWHVILSNETVGYYSDYQRPLEKLQRNLSAGFAFQGDQSEHRGGARRGEPSGHLSPLAFVNFLQNHDQIGNRALGDRLETLSTSKTMEAALAMTLLAPMPPLMFMGEEWGAQTPFPFFCDFDGDLARAVREGRKREFKSAYAKYGDDVPDPLAASTFESAKLNWAEPKEKENGNRLALISKLLAIRHRRIVPHLASVRFGHAEISEYGLLNAQWMLHDGQKLNLMANLADTKSTAVHSLSGNVIWETSGDVLAPWSVIWTLGGRS